MPDLKFTVTVRDDGSAVIQQFADNTKQATDSVGESFSSAGLAMMGWLETAKIVVGFADSLISSYAEMEKNITVLNAALVTSGNNLQSTSIAFQELADHIANTTFASKNQALEAERTLLQYGVSAERMQEVLTSLAVYSAAFGKDFESTVMRVSYAISGMTDNLHRIGIPVDLKGVTDEGERLDRVMEAIQPKIRNVADLISGSAAMQVHQGANEWQQFKDVVGGFLWEHWGRGVVLVTDAVEQLDLKTRAANGDLQAFLQLQINNAQATIAKAQHDIDHYKENSSFWNWLYEEKPEEAQKSIDDATKLYREAIAKMAALKAEQARTPIVGDETEDQMFAPFRNFMKKLQDNKIKDILKESGEGQVQAVKMMYDALGKEGKAYFDQESTEGDMSIKAQVKRIDEAEKIDDEAGQKRSRDFDKWCKVQEDREKKKADTLKKIREAEFSAASNFLQAGAQLSATFGAKNVALNKAFQISQAIINTSAAVVKALAEVPYPADIPYAASLAAMGAAQIATIAGVSDSGSSAGNVSGLGSASVGGATGGNVMSAGGVPLSQTSIPSGPSMNIVVQGFVGDESKLATEIGRIMREANGDNVSFGLQTTRR